MIVAAAICPHPPLLVPVVASGAARELADLRSSCTAAVRRLLAASPDVVCVVGDGSVERWYAEGASGSLHPYGVPVDASLGLSTGGPATLPLSLTVGAWLLGSFEWLGKRCAVSVPGTATEADLTRCGAQLTALAPTVGLLVMGDGSARRSEQAPGYVDARAAGFDASVAAALGSADTAALAGLDPELGAQLLAAGTTPWRLLGRAAAGGEWDAELLSDTAPYGVGYLVATWVRSR